MAVRYIKSGGVAERRIRREHVLVPVMPNMESLDSIYSLNEVAGYIWDHLGESRTVDEISSLIIKEYAVDEQTARPDIERILHELTTIGAITAVNERT